MTIPDYLETIKERLLAEPIVTRFEVIRERVTQVDGYIRARVTLSDETRLEFSEYFQLISDGEIAVTTYSYHWSKPDGGLICRWDNTPHFPELENFPHHVHQDESGGALPGKPMNIFVVLDEIIGKIRY